MQSCNGFMLRSLLLKNIFGFYSKKDPEQVINMLFYVFPVNLMLLFAGCNWINNASYDPANSYKDTGYYYDPNQLYTDPLPDGTYNVEPYYAW